MNKVICIDDTNKPNEIPTTRWVKKNNIYTITEISKLNMQGGLYGCKLAEINNDDLFPYQYFRLSRFAEITDLNSEEVTENVEELVETV